MVSRMSSGRIRPLAKSFSLIVQLKALLVAGRSAMTMSRWKPARKTNRRQRHGHGRRDGCVSALRSRIPLPAKPGEFDLKTSSWVLTPAKTGIWAVHCSVTAALIPFSPITTAPIPIMVLGVSEPPCGFKPLLPHVTLTQWMLRKYFTQVVQDKYLILII